MSKSILEIPKAHYTEAFHDAAREMSTLGPKLDHDPLVVQNHLLDQIGATASKEAIEYVNNPDIHYDTDHTDMHHVIEEATILAKIERYSLIKFCTDEQHPLLVAGEGRQAIIQPGLIKDLEGTFEDTLRNLYIHTGERVMEKYHSWFFAAILRYRQLGKTARDAYAKRPFLTAPAATSNLVASMDGGQMPSAIYDLSVLMRNKSPTQDLVGESAEKAAHDLSYLAAKRASQNFHGIIGHGLWNLGGDIIYLHKQDRYIYREIPAQEPNEPDGEYEKRKLAAKQQSDIVFGKGTSLDGQMANYGPFFGPTFKCPVHQPTKEQPTGHLQSQAHAAINYASDNFNLFRPRRLFG